MRPPVVVLDPPRQFPVELRQGVHPHLALPQSSASETDLSFIPDAMHASAQRLPALLESGRMEEVRERPISLVSRIEAYEAPDRGNGKPGARLLFRANLVGTVDLLGGKVKTDNSPGGILAILHGVEEPTAQALIRRRRGGWNSKVPPPARCEWVLLPAEPAPVLPVMRETGGQPEPRTPPGPTGGGNRGEVRLPSSARRR
jgi:hypothetical protein